ncbi:hypothetical protein [Streptomyces sp. CC228A]|uniref:hypothetical protein n=1 Tax=Streptomyces sp. CC228A TaxID=2898186 RepID=UPI001F2A77C6|nr:hypothetical protein [Streptomyces sp. CC228A]
MTDVRQETAVCIGLLLLIGGVLIGRELIGLWPTFTVSTAAVVAHFATPIAAREVAVRRYARHLRRHL